MQTDRQLCSYVAQLFLKLEMFRAKFVLKMKTHVIYSLPFPENRDDFAIKWEIVVETDRPQVTT